MQYVVSNDVFVALSFAGDSVVETWGTSTHASVCVLGGKMECPDIISVEIPYITESSGLGKVQITPRSQPCQFHPILKISVSASGLAPVSIVSGETKPAINSVLSHFSGHFIETSEEINDLLVQSQDNTLQIEWVSDPCSPELYELKVVCAAEGRTIHA